MLKDPSPMLGQPENTGRQKMERRDQLYLLLDLLNAMSEPVKKTHLLYRTHINYYQLTRYLGLLLRLEMVKEISHPFDGYIITEKGRLMQSLFNTRS